MSAEPWRRTRTAVAPRLSAWQAWHFGHFRLDLCGRWQVWYFRDLCRCPRNLGDELGLLWRRGFLRGRRGALAMLARCAWQVWYFRDLCRCPRNLGDELGLLWRRGFLRGRRGTFGTSASICVAGVVLSGPL